MLTTDVDGPADFTGGAGEDTFIADNTGAAETTSTADGLDGGAGTDTINIFSDGSIGAAPALSNIEVAVIYDEDANLNLSSSSWDSLTTASLVRGDGDIGLTLGVNATTVNLSDIGLDDASANNGVTVTAEATVTSMTLGLDKITVGTNSGDEDVTVNGAALTTVNVVTSGTASSFEVLDVDAATTIAIDAAVDFTVSALATTGTASLALSGAGDISLATLDADIDTVTSTATGSLTALIGAAVDTVLTSGTGNDVITASTEDTIATSDTLAVNAGDGTDTLVIAATADVNSAADGARYTNFETLSLADSQDVSLVSGITSLLLGATTSETFSGLNATQAAAITVTASNTTASTFALTTATGGSDVLTLNLTSGTATTNVDVAGLVVTGFETVNFNATTGTAGTQSDITFGAAGELTAVNITGSAETTLATANITSVVAIDANAATGAVTVSGDLTSGSTVVGSSTAINSFVTTTTNGSTYTGGAADDSITTAVAGLVATGSDDTAVNGGDGEDTLVISTTAATLTDLHFTNVTNMENLTTSTGTTSIITGGSFNTAFTSGVTLTTGQLADNSDFNFVGGLYAQNTTIVIDATALSQDSAGDDVNVATGAGDDNVTFTGDATTVGNAGTNDGGAIVIETAAGNDTISVTHGTLDDQTTSQFATIDAGTGADTITKVGVNGTDIATTTHFVIADGDSVKGSRDTITGLDLVVNAGALFGDVLDFDSATVAAALTEIDSGTILTHAISNGMVTFDDASAFNAAIVINSANLSDVLGYLEANVVATETVAFLYDSSGDASADATIVFNNDTLDSVVELVGVQAAGISATATSTTDDFLIIG